MVTVSSRFRIKKCWNEQSDSNRCLTILQTVAFVRLAMLAFEFWILNFGLNKKHYSCIKNLKSKIQMRTTGFEPAISNLKDWRLNQFAYVLK